MHRYQSATELEDVNDYIVRVVIHDVPHLHTHRAGLRLIGGLRDRTKRERNYGEQFRPHRTLESETQAEVVRRGSGHLTRGRWSFLRTLLISGRNSSARLLVANPEYASPLRTQACAASL